jgi:hypothetical protein
MPGLLTRLLDLLNPRGNQVLARSFLGEGDVRDSHDIGHAVCDAQDGHQDRRGEHHSHHRVLGPSLARPAFGHVLREEKQKQLDHDPLRSSGAAEGERGALPELSALGPATRRRRGLIDFLDSPRARRYWSGWKGVRKSSPTPSGGSGFEAGTHDCPDTKPASSRVVPSARRRRPEHVGNQWVSRPTKAPLHNWGRGAS